MKYSICKKLITTKKYRKMKKSTLLIFLMAIGTAVFAQNYNFTNGGGDSKWSNPANWDQGSAPSTINHLAYIGANPPTAFNVEVDVDNAFAGYLEMRNGATLVVKNSGKLTISYPPDIPNGINIQLFSTTTLTVDQGGTLEYDGAILVNGDLIVNGTVEFLPPPPPVK